MKLLHPVLAVIALALVWSGCTTPNTSALRIGMTKEEAIKVMGEPNSVSAQGGFEYLNYILSEGAANGGYWTRPYYVRLADGKVQAYGYSEQINRLMPPAGSFANAAAKSAALRVGMTKEEAIAVMGAPGSVSAQGTYEYLNYTSSEVSPTGFSTMTRPYYVRLSEGHVDAFGFTDQIGRTLPMVGVVSSSRAESSGALTVLSVMPMPLVAGKAQEVTIRVKYFARSGDRFRIVALCNAASPTRFAQIADQVVEGNNGEAELKAVITPAEWESGRFRVMAQMYEYPPVPGQRAIAVAPPYSITLTQ
jgi:outer membrane protein assembly factor BamE (lipoprotein component of BamABCDE complex)